MTLTSIKNQIVFQLSKLTIDDYYSDPEISFVKNIFLKETKLKSEDEIEHYLKKRFPETISYTFRNSLNQDIEELNRKISNIKKTIKTTENKIGKKEIIIKEKEKKQNDNPKKERKIKSELKDIETEINIIKTLANKVPYEKQFETLVKKKNELTKELSDNSAEILKEKDELEKLQKEITNEKKFIIQKQTEINKIQTIIDKKQQELKELLELEETHFKNEYLSLEFLFKILVHKKINKIEILTNKNTNEKIPIYPAYDNYDNDFIKTGEQELEISNYDFDKVSEFITSYTNTACIIPKDWRKIIYKILSAPISNFAGTITNTTRNNTKYFTRNNVSLKNIDLTAFLATKIALKTKYSVSTADNKIVLGMPGGLSAKILFREKGELISKYQNQTIEIYANCLSYMQYVYQTLYYQAGYEEGQIRIETPTGYYILTEKFVIEIDFNAAPMLFDNNSIIQFASNISSKAKRNDELKAEEEAEEERIRREDEDNNWYDENDSF